LKRNYILVTGGTGYIGSHLVLQLLEKNENVVIYDNLSNSNFKVLEILRKLSGKNFEFVKGDINNRNSLQSLFAKFNFETVFHLAGLKSVSESSKYPLKYFETNVAGTLNLINFMIASKTNQLIFSSSATVYGESEKSVFDENSQLQPKSVYGQSKLMSEKIIEAVALANSEFKYSILRYFNPVGAHASGYIGEDPTDTPNNLFPYVTQVAIGKLPALNVWGNDYPTSDGTGMRDYIHIEDLASGHISALSYLRTRNSSSTVNLGTGKSKSVLEVIKSFEKVSGKSIPFNICGRRDGDVAESLANPSLAKKLFGWEALKTLEQMCADAWRWQNTNPNGFN
jgi:UDP-glucose 4-epimerase